MTVRSFIFLLIFTPISLSAFAGLIQPKGYIDVNSYTDDSSNAVYWTNHELSLDIMRFSWSDTLKADGTTNGNQSSVSVIDEFLTSNTNNNWRWASPTEFMNIFNWFDTDLSSQCCTKKQFQGSHLFFNLNGIGPRYSESNGYFNNGFREDGWNIWNMQSFYSAEQYIGSGSIGINAQPEHNANCEQWCDYGWLRSEGIGEDGFFDTTFHRPSAAYRLQTDSLNNAPLLVRSATSVSEPPSLLLIFGMLLIIYRKLLSSAM